MGRNRSEIWWGRNKRGIWWVEIGVEYGGVEIGVKYGGVEIGVQRRIVFFFRLKMVWIALGRPPNPLKFKNSSENFHKIGKIGKKIGNDILDIRFFPDFLLISHRNMVGWVKRPMMFVATVWDWIQTWDTGETRQVEKCRACHGDW